MLFDLLRTENIMALTEKIEIDRIEVVDMGIIQVRQATVIERDGDFVSRTFHRWVLTPDMDISDQEQKVQDIANAAWTPEVRQAYETFKAAQRMTP
jgi:hypothetical protein